MVDKSLWDFIEGNTTGKSNFVLKNISNLPRMAAESLVKPKIYIGGILDPAALARGSWFEKVFYRVIKSNCYKKYLPDKPKKCKKE